MASSSATEPDAPAAPLDPATVLEEAADLLLIHGRCKGVWFTLGGQMCVIGAIGRVMETDDFAAVMRTPAVAAIRESVGRHFVPDWNDNTEDDFEVIDTLRHVAKDLRNEAQS